MSERTPAPPLTAVQRCTLRIRTRTGAVPREDADAIRVALARLDHLEAEARRYYLPGGASVVLDSAEEVTRRRIEAANRQAALARQLAAARDHLQSFAEFAAESGWPNLSLEFAGFAHQADAALAEPEGRTDG
jgi:hypothetical protein